MLAEPIYAETPVAATITVEAEEDIEDVLIVLWIGDPDAWVNGESDWTVDLQAHTPVQFSTQVGFPSREGDFSVHASVHNVASSKLVDDIEDVYITADGRGVLNPTPVPHERTPEPLSTIDPATLPTSVSPLPTPEMTVTAPVTFTLPPSGEVLPNLDSIVAEHRDLDASIPDDGSWISYTLPITTVPSGITVTGGVSSKIVVAHPRPQDLVAEVVAPDGVTRRALDESKPLEEFCTGCVVLSAHRVEDFVGQPVNAVWTLRIRDTKPGKSGTLHVVSVAMLYLQSTSSGWPSPVTAASQSSQAVLGSMELIVNQSFEGMFPTTQWWAVDLKSDSYERYWDRDDYRSYLGDLAAWPASGGRDGIDPSMYPHHYPNNMHTRMIYGPFDLSDAGYATIYFWLWRELEVGYDKLYFEISYDGIAFETLKQWNDVNMSWQGQSLSFDGRGDGSVWVAWRFDSDGSISRQGPWIDDVAIYKFVPGQVYPQGTFYFYDRGDNRLPVRQTRVYLYESDTDSADDLLASTTTDDNGSWQLGPLTNWDNDGTHWNGLPGGPLDLYTVLETDVAYDGIVRHRVVDLNNWAYKWESGIYGNVPDGIFNFDPATIINGSNFEPAMWIFQDLWRARKYILDHGGSADPGPVTAHWEKDKTSFSFCQNNSCFTPPGLGDGIFISHNHIESADTVIHELGHQYMFNATGQWWLPGVIDTINCFEHYFEEQDSALCGWTEGWADFLPLAVNGDVCFDDNNISCGLGSTNFETPTWGTAGWDDGDEVEGRVAGALHDLFDQANEGPAAAGPGQDQVAFGFAPIWEIVSDDTQEKSFHEFWDSWRVNTYHQHFAVQALSYNTIDYNTPPDIIIPADVVALQNLTRDNAIDLWLVSSDAESLDSQLEWQIIHTTNWRCGVSIDAQDYVDINPLPSWLGDCEVIIQVTDGLATADTLFTVHVVPVVGRVFLPLVLRNYGGSSLLSIPTGTTFTSPLAPPPLDTFLSPLPVPEP